MNIWSGIVDDVRTYFALPKLYAKEGWESSTDLFYIPSLTAETVRSN